MHLMTLARKGVVLIAAALLLAVGFASSPASARDSTTWVPQTPVAGAPHDPGYWDNQALIPFSGPGSVVTNVTLAPQFVTSTSTTTNTSTTYDYSKPTTNVAGSENNTTVNTGATFTGDHSSLSIATTNNDGH
jgi:hypothetical protein